MATLRLATTPSPSSVGDGVKRVSVGMSSTIEGSPVRSVCPAASLSLMFSGIPPCPRGSAAMPTEATMRSRSLAGSSSSTRPRSTPSVNVATVTASVMSSVRSWLPSAKRPSAATALCWRARRASCCAAWVGSVTSRATTSSDSTVPSAACTGTAWMANVSPSLTSSNARRSPFSPAR